MNRQFKVASSLFAFLQILLRSGFNEFLIQKFKEAEFLLEQTIQSPFEFICFFANIIEKRLSCLSSRYKNSKRQNFHSNRQFTVASSLFAFLQIRIEKRLCCLSSRYKNSKRQNFLTNRQFIVNRVYLLFCKYYREDVFAHLFE